MIERPQLDAVVPHKDSMILIDRIVDYDLGARRLISEVDTAADNLFYNETLGGIPVWTGFEYMAQSIAALSGLNNRFSRGGEPRVGFIMSVRDFRTSLPVFPPGITLRTEVRQFFRDENVVSFDCTIARRGTAPQTLTTAIVNAIEFEEHTINAGIFDD